MQAQLLTSAVIAYDSTLPVNVAKNLRSELSRSSNPLSRNLLYCNWFSLALNSHRRTGNRSPTVPLTILGRRFATLS